MPPKNPAKKPRAQQPELAFQAKVIAMCDGRDLWPVIVNPARFAQRTASNQGFPDLQIIGPGGVLYRELKTDAGAYRGLRPAQVTWRDRLRSSGQDWATWTPRDHRDGRIADQLAAIEQPREDADRFTLAMLGVVTVDPSAPSGAAGGAEDGDGQADEDPGADSTTMRKALPWLLAGGVAVAAAIAINRG